MTTHDDEVALGIAAAKAGQHDVARQHFQSVLRNDPRNEAAWLWLSGLVGPQQRRDCLQRVLAINPANELARRGMEELAHTEAASFLATFEPRTSPAPVAAIPIAPPTAPPELSPPITEPVPIDLGEAPTVPMAVFVPSVVGIAPATSAAPVELPPISTVTAAPCVFCGAPTGVDGQCAACGMEQVFDCPLCSRSLDLREQMNCECGQSMQPFISGNKLDRERLGDEYLMRDYPGAAVKQWKAAVTTSPRPAQLHRKIATVYLDLGLVEQARQHNELSKQK